LRIAFIDDKRMIPFSDQVFHGQGFHVGEIHHHTAIRCPDILDQIAFERNLDHITMPMQIAALAAVIGDAVPCIEFKFTGYF